ncbi:MAG TPA: DUF3489 domain-containing protein [Caulobacteraceae bacterium]|nr:DUF3489 domain-containing protein [Caulobacteraceae bacterium]
MPKRTAPQQKLHALAAEAEGAAIEAQDAANATVATLVKRGLLISVPQASGAGKLSITEAGRASIETALIPAPEPRRSDPIVPDPALEPEANYPRPKGKIGLLLDLLGRDGGVTIETMMAATGWQAHSVRGAISGAIKKTLSFNVISEKTDAGRTYHIAQDGAA